MEPIDYAMLALRLWAGLVIIAHGINHGRSLEGTANWFESKGFRQPKLNALLSSATELAVGVGLIVGLLTSVAAAGLVSIMLVAFWAIHRFAGFFVFHRPDEGYEYVITLAVVSLAIAIIGPGAASLDEAFSIAGNLDGGVGALIIVGGVLAAAGQLAVFWRKPVAVETQA